MKRIGIVSKVEYYIPRVDRLSDIERLSPIDRRFFNIKSLEICVLNKNGELEFICPTVYENSFINSRFYSEGTIVSYDDEIDINGVLPVDFAIFSDDSYCNEFIKLFGQLYKKFGTLEKNKDADEISKIAKVLYNCVWNVSKCDQVARQLPFRVFR